MKNISSVLLLLSLSGFGNSVFAEDYYAPVKKELEALARIPLTNFQMNDQIISYSLPRDLTGDKLDVLLQRDLSIPGDTPRIYRGDKADIACMGSNDLPACVVTHKNLAINTQAARDFLKGKFRDPQKLLDAEKVLEQFASGSQPLGVISKRTDFVPPPIPKVWMVDILLNGQAVGSLSNVAKAELNLESLKFGPSTQMDWPVSDLTIDANHIAGDYVRADQKHWLDITLNTERTSFEGTWGWFDAAGNPLPAAGLLKGEMK